MTGGIFKGIRLQAPLAPARATTDRMRQAIFSSISELVCDAEVLDLFAGCGSLGIEAVSRGAKRATFVENAKSSWKVLEENLRRLGIGDRVRVCKVDVGKFLEETARRGEKWDLVFADPPYFTG
ncbi:MAG: RsmD family RNA methyltransferase, partial [Chthoniobacterales bacterium]|nr:RsmD family RNA methyltransferase [Chthoniobacterales bacterium]